MSEPEHYPMLFAVMPVLLVALLPAAVIEALFLCGLLVVGAFDALRGALKAKLWSTLLGIPVAWLLMFTAVDVLDGQALGLYTNSQRLYGVTVQAPWVVLYETDIHWMIPAASLTLLVPFFFVSVQVEYLALRNRWKSKNPLVALWVGNLISFALLGVYYALWLHSAGQTGGRWSLPS